MNTTLVSFLIRAKKATYVGGGAKARASRTASHDLTFDEGEWRNRGYGGVLVM